MKMFLYSKIMEIAVFTSSNAAIPRNTVQAVSMAANYAGQT